MNYGCTSDCTDWPAPDWRDKFLSYVLFFIPRGNPTYEILFPKIKKWCLELDDTGAVAREIALDCDGQPLFHVPDGSENLGFWIDEDRIFSAEELEPMTQGEFERLWLLSEQRRSGRQEAK